MHLTAHPCTPTSSSLRLLSGDLHAPTVPPVTSLCRLSPPVQISLFSATVSHADSELPNRRPKILCNRK